MGIDILIGLFVAAVVIRGEYKRFVKRFLNSL
jgi:hypothetical protein